MFKVYAFEPEAICNPVLGASLEQFGFEHGRLIARVPKPWGKEIRQWYRNECPNDKLLEVRLSRLHKRNAIQRVPLDAPKSAKWLDRVIQYTPDDIHGIIVRSKDESVDPRIISDDDIHDDNPVWHVANGGRIPRTEPEMAAAAKVLVRFSSEIKFVDAYFSGKKRHRQFIEACLQARLSQPAKPVVGFEIHFLLKCNHKIDRKSPERKEDARRIFDEVRSECLKWQLKKLLDSNEKLDLYQWQELEYGERFHERFLLTDLGGIEFGGGLDTGGRWQTTSVHRLTESVRSDLNATYRKGSKTFDLLNNCTIDSRS